MYFLRWKRGVRPQASEDLMQFPNRNASTASIESRSIDARQSLSGRPGAEKATCVCLTQRGHRSSVKGIRSDRSGVCWRGERFAIPRVAEDARYRFCRLFPRHRPCDLSKQRRRPAHSTQPPRLPGRRRPILSGPSTGASLMPRARLRRRWHIVKPGSPSIGRPKSFNPE